ncbi:hypothetical protein CAPTEDRAFT_213116 [Capitella teleta]|uniref:Uncharacterized protein n=1 Tax=Capitella teleta TaxID=283909 RepID=R7VLL9_CAPTE|nr:hypothetical protein CAPTEDRAFT_213116 [Capitella teleta]|eukprot:ELU18411.1 hypothetical protein CAPTEDRAFT_213116 [Capitella teleta]
MYGLSKWPEKLRSGPNPTNLRQPLMLKLSWRECMQTCFQTLLANHLQEKSRHFMRTVHDEAGISFSSPTHRKTSLGSTLKHGRDSPDIMTIALVGDSHICRLGEYLQQEDLTDLCMSYAWMWGLCRPENDSFLDGIHFSDKGNAKFYRGVRGAILRIWND